MTLLVDERPVTVLDLGVGFGMYGAAIRNWLDRGVTPYRTYLAGIEGHAPYRNPVWDLYDRIEVGKIQDTNFRELLPEGKKGWDCILMSDVIEHFTDEEALRQIERCKQVLAPGGKIIISTPGWQSHQGAAHGNQLERHLSLFTSKELEPLGFKTLRKEGLQEDGRNNVISVFENGPYRGPSQHRHKKPAAKRRRAQMAGKA